ncbi:PglZ domain-containing protein [Desulfonema limicola]|uniref:PglZ domain-containing protein n=1 Tax=Desulfonema limicola TaxID=45656 RepID=UPI001A9BC936|nr:PglZ domain-containing protein [Desulfonema limicola]
MIDKWFTQDIEKILKEKNRIVISAPDKNAGFLLKLIPEKYPVFQTGNEIQELKAKYEIEKNYPDKKIIIFTDTPREKMKFIREYCETCGCIDIKYLHNYVKEKVHRTLELNLPLTPDEVATAAKISIGKTDDYWRDLAHKGKSRLFDIGAEIHPFLNNPGEYCNKLDNQVKKEFLSRLNKWLGRENIEQPPETLAKEAAEKILGSLITGSGEKKFKEVYKKWADSKKYEQSLDHYISETVHGFGDNIWSADVSHPFTSLDRLWVIDICRNLDNREYIQGKLDIIRKRDADKTGKKLYKTLWQDILSFLEFKTDAINSLSTFDKTLEFYTRHFYKLDTAVRRLYSFFLNEPEIIQPVHEYYTSILTLFLDKWHTSFKDYRENQTGLIEQILDNEPGKCAIIAGDGITYEISVIVGEKLKNRYKTNCKFILADFPSTTENNMSRIYMKTGSIEPVHKKREEYLLDKYNEKIGFISLDKVSYSTGNTQYLVCTCKDIDSIAEKMQQNALKFISQIEKELAEKIGQLIKCGYKKVYLTSDHGFVLTGLLSESDKIEFDFKGKTEKSERFVKTAEKQEKTENLVEIKQSGEEFNYIYFIKAADPLKQKECTAIPTAAYHPRN